MSKNQKHIFKKLPEDLIKKIGKMNQLVKLPKTLKINNRTQDLMAKNQKNLCNKDGTIKDSLTELDIYYKENQPFKNKPKLIKNNCKGINKNTINTILQSSLETTQTINKSIEANTIFNLNIYNTNSEHMYNSDTKKKNTKPKMFNYQKFVINEKISGRVITESKGEDTLNNDYLNNDNTSSDIIEYCSNESTLNKINIEILSKIKIIYEEMKLQFPNKENTVNEKIQNIDNLIGISSEKYDSCLKVKALAFDYFQFLFGDDIKYIIKLFNYCLEIGEFILTQFYLFLGILFFEQNQKIDDCFQLSYRTVFSYSEQNFNSLISFIQNPSYISEPNKMKVIKNKNKIIISILKAIHMNSQANIFLKRIIDENINFIGGFPYRCLIDICNYSKIKPIKTLISEFNLNIMNNSSNSKSIGIINLLSVVHDNILFKNQFYSIQQQAKNNPEFSENFNDNTNKKSSPNLFNFIYLNNEKLLLKYERKIFEEKKNLLVPPFEKNNNIKYHIIIDLDETLVHYCEENNNYFVKVRCGVENFIKKISEFCEIIILSTSSKEYTDIIVNRINKGKEYVKNIIYKEIYDELNEYELNLSNINRNLNKCIFICHEKEFYGAPSKNILQISEFEGDESDKEIVYLQNELAKIENINGVTDVSYLITDIMFGIDYEKRKNQKK